MRCDVCNADEVHANAALIVRAVNAHDALVAACRNILAQIDTPLTLTLGQHEFHRTTIIRMLRTALAKAGEV